MLSTWKISQSTDPKGVSRVAVPSETPTDLASSLNLMLSMKES